METLEIKKLIQLNISTEDFHGVPGEFGKNENGKWDYLIDWNKLPNRYTDICNQNIDIISKLVETRNKRTDILTGDFLILPDGSESRITYNWGDSVQDGGGSSSFYLHSSGNASYSGGLNDPKPVKKITFTGKTKTALFWIFSKNWSGSNRGFHFYIDVKIWELKY
jgi:hypothetical protein